MRVHMDMNIDSFVKGIYASMNRVGKRTKQFTTIAGQQIFEESQKEVPKDTSTLMSSGSIMVVGRSPHFTCIITYGIDKDPVNPVTGQPASAYAAIVHEDLSAYHPNGKAKFLEDPILRYAQRYPVSYKQILRQFT